MFLGLRVGEEWRFGSMCYLLLVVCGGSCLYLCLGFCLLCGLLLGLFVVWRFGLAVRLLLVGLCGWVFGVGYWFGAWWFMLAVSYFYFVLPHNENYSGIWGFRVYTLG